MFRESVTVVTDRFTLHSPESDRDVRACFELMRELRPHLSGPNAFVEQVCRQAAAGYRLLAVWHNSEPVALAGYRYLENLVHGRFMYVDDLVTRRASRRDGLGRILIDALRERARHDGCARLVLDTGLSNALAQRFYFRQGLLATGLHFSEPL